MRKPVHLATAFALATGAAGSVHAQSAGRGAGLEEIIVTATKRDTTIQQTPIAVNALDADTLANQQIQDIQDIAHTIPGVSFTSTLPGRAIVVLRGISPIGGQPTVGLYIDDIPMTGNIGLLQGMSEPRLLDVERVEVLKGPQGTLYGASSMGGAIKLVSTKPDATRFSGKVHAGVNAVAHGDMGYEGDAVLNIPLVEARVALRVGGGYRLEGGYIDRVAGGSWADLYRRTDATTLTLQQLPTGNQVADDDINDLKVTLGKAALLFKPSDAVEIIASINYSKSEYGDIGQYWANLGRFKTSGLLAQPVDEELTVGGLSVNADLGATTFTSLTGYFKRDVSLTGDYSFYLRSLLGPTGTGAFFANIPSNRVQANAGETWSQEFRLASNDKESKLQWLIGVYGSDTDTDRDPRINSFGVSALVPAATAPLVAGDVVFGTDGRGSIKEYAVFGEATYALTDQLALTVGARYFKNKNTTVNSSFGLLAGGTIAPVTIKSDEDGVNPKVTLSYTVADDHMVYATASKGFRPGGPNTPVPTSQCAADLARLGLSAAPTTYDSDSLWNYEIGSKNQFANRRLTVNGAVYYIDWSKIQQSVSLSCGFPFIGNVGEAESRGLELEVNALLTDSLQVGISAALADTKVTKTVPGVTAQVDDDILGVPNTVLNGYVQYTLPLSGDYSLRARADHQYRSSQLMAFEDTIRVNVLTGGTATIANPGREQGSTSLTNLSVGFGAAAYDLTLYVHNVFDRDDVLDPNVLLRIPQQSAPTPRTVGLEAAYRFE